MSEKSSHEISPWITIAMDLVSLVLTFGPGALSWAGMILLFRFFWDSPYLGLIAVFDLLLGLFLFIFCVFSFRLILPKLKPGVYPLGFNRGMVAWSCHLALSRAAEVSGFKSLIHCFYLFKFLYWRACGARIGYRINSSINVAFVDLPLIQIGNDSTISDGVLIAGHTFVGNRILIGPVEVGQGVFIGANTLIGPKSKIGDGAWVGSHNKIFRDRILNHSKLEDAEWEKGNPKRHTKRYQQVPEN
jgi:acetyltransferase-like isoleucine patch superfamily enzyme